MGWLGKCGVGLAGAAAIAAGEGVMLGAGVGGSDVGMAGVGWTPAVVGAGAIE